MNTALFLLLELVAGVVIFFLVGFVYFCLPGIISDWRRRRMHGQRTRAGRKIVDLQDFRAQRERRFSSRPA